MSHRMSRNEYAGYYGPTAGDKIRLGDTALVAEIERDSTVLGDEAIASGERSVRDAMGGGTAGDGALDSVIVNAVIIDWTGIFKADIGIKGGRIAAIGKAGNPDVMAGVTPGMVIGAATEIISAEGLIATAGGIDGNLALVSARQAESALAGGVTTILGGGPGHAADFEASSGTPGARHIEMLLQATDDLPLNFGFYARAGTPNADSLAEQVRGGAAGLCLHESTGLGAAALESCLAASIQYDLPVNLHPDPHGEAGGVDALLKVLNGRPALFQLDLGSNGLAGQDGLKVCGEARVLPMSAGSARPNTINTMDEQRELLFARRRMDRNAKQDSAIAETAVLAGAIGAEDMLHDLGAIPAICSGGMASGRPADLIARAWRTAHKMSEQRGRLSNERGMNDNIRVRRYIAKYTINPAILCGISHEVGSLEGGKLADIVLWKPAFFGIKPEKIFKGGVAVWGQSGAAGAAISRVQPSISQPLIGGRGTAVAHTSLVFVSKHSLRQGALMEYNLSKKVAPVRGWRSLSKAEMRLNDAAPKITIDAKRNFIAADGQSLACEPSENMPLAQRYALF